MADYIYLLETRLSKAQRTAIDAVRDLAKSKGLMVFLVGGAVRDLTSGSPVRDLDLVVQGNALKLKKDMEKAGAILSGENDPGQALYLKFPGGVRMELGSTLSVTYPKPGKPVVKMASLLDDLRRRDFTANAMALSLNEGSLGLLMDPLNGVADIENRELRLVSNYGFIEDPVRMVRAVRFMARLGWQMEEKTQGRYETGKQEGYISALSEFHRGYETEEIFHEEDPLRVMRRLEEEGWMQHLLPSLTVTKANVPELERLRELQMQLQMQGILADAATANFPLLTAKLSAAEVKQLKQIFPRQGFVSEIDSLDARAKEFAGQILAKTSLLPSQTFQLIHGASPESVLWAGYTSKSAALQAKLKSFQGDWPQARQRIPYLLMQEMRIVPELPQYAELLETLFYQLMDGKLSTVEEIKAFLEPYSPPAPPPPVHLRRARSAKKDAKGSKGRKKVAAVSPDEDDDDTDIGADGNEAGGTEDETKLQVIAGDEVAGELPEDDDAGGADELDEAPVRKPAPATKLTGAPVSIEPKPEVLAPVEEPPAKSSATVPSAKLAATVPRPALKPAPTKAPATPRVRPQPQVPVASKSAPASTKSVKVVAPPPKVVSVKKAGTKAASTNAKSAVTKAPPSVRASKAVPAKKTVARPASKKAVPGKKASPPVKVPVKKSPTKSVPAKKAAALKKVAKKR